MCYLYMTLRSSFKDCKDYDLEPFMSKKTQLAQYHTEIQLSTK